MAIGVAILGAGLFGKDQYLPAVKGSSSYTLKAVYSRSQKSSTKLGEEAGVDAYYDNPETPDRSLSNLLERSDIDAVIIALPITVQPDIIRAAWKAGKHVLSEKPVAKDSTGARQLIADYEPYKAKGQVWAVAENFRFIDPITYGTAQLERLGGAVTGFHVSVHDMVKDGNPFYATEWRKNPDYQGGFVLDGGVHFVAGLREFLSALGDSIEKAVSFSTQMQPHLPPVDTVNGAYLLKSGRSGTISLSFGIEFKSDFLIEVTSTNGSVAMTPAGVKVVERGGSDGERKEALKEFPFNTGVGLEIEAFGKAIEKKAADPRQTAEEALLDLVLIEKLLTGEQGGAVLTI
ncbi:hypothetical protein EYB25_006464 [Talaromyces marneffei]|uniref:Uncharacterized protein n=1 Tax=Talaromyces marneffei PM1 TaxID=1077442 RepID=A0A093UZC9_TALMA|nr:uncharacterized protein EYB26_007601 [Talaromyces marneffei]KAE8550243.1 hypothetical protein EYB25_006464 [Talaromyces marneffei]QGA19906.1 hypothetical protein EYB26_007601 [Talaromyces marneffei]